MNCRLLVSTPNDKISFRYNSALGLSTMAWSRRGGKCGGGGEWAARAKSSCNRVKGSSEKEGNRQG